MANNNQEANRFWDSVISQTLTGGHDGKNPFVVSKFFEGGREVPRPEDTSLLHWSVGELKGQIKDWRASFDNIEQGFHAVEFDDRYKCHIDKVDPDKDPLGHLVEDSPITLILVLAALAAGGAGVYYFYKKKRKEGDGDEKEEI